MIAQKNNVFRWFVFALAGSLLFVSWLIWQNQRLTTAVLYHGYKIDTLSKLQSIPKFGIGPLKATLRVQEKAATIESQQVVEVAKEYLQRKPLDAKGWLWLSLFQQRAGDLDAAKAALLRAHKLAARNSIQLSKVFNRYVELGLYDQAMLVGRDLSYNKPNQFRQIFYLMSRLVESYDKVVEQVVPDSVPQVRPGRKPFGPAQYYSWAINDAVSAGNESLAAAIWRKTPANLRKGSDFGLRYIEYLAGYQLSDRLQQVWLQHLGEPLLVGELPNQRFDDDKTACWRLRGVDEGAALHEPLVVGESHGLKVTFTGKENINYNHATCVFLVEANAEYKLLGRWKGENITTLSGPFLELYAPSIRSFYKRNTPEIGSWPWQDFSIDFKSTNDTKVLVARLRRASTDYLDSKISGSVSIKDIRLVRVARGEQSNSEDIGSKIAN